eukprot:jgi/Botrbrau1/4242/Bobra.0044s0037.1
MSRHLTLQKPAIGPLPQDMSCHAHCQRDSVEDGTHHTPPHTTGHEGAQLHSSLWWLRTLRKEVLTCRDRDSTPRPDRAETWRLLETAVFNDCQVIDQRH